jgi:CTP:molybdopterin cytidylyltransferase MocA
MRNQVAGILLAAGEGTRLGTPKAVVQLAGKRLVEWGVALLRDGGTSPIVVVTGAVTVDTAGVVIVPNPAWRTGMASSLAAGLRALPDSAEAAVIALVDQPLIGPQAVARLIAAYQAGAVAAVAAYGGEPRNPVLLARGLWADVLASATGDQGARSYLRRHPDVVALVECADTGRPDDVDTPEDLARITRLVSTKTVPARSARD